MSLTTARVVSSPESPYNDGADNMTNILVDYRSQLGLRKSYNYDPWYISALPSTAIELISDNETVPALGIHRRGSAHKINYDLTLRYRVWYYQEEVSKRQNVRLMYEKLWAINAVYKTHPTINGYATIGYAEVSDVVPSAREREGTTYAGGYIDVSFTRRICHEHDPVVVPPL